MYSFTVEYALCILGAMAGRSRPSWRAEELAKRLSLPRPYTSKVLQRLKAGGFVTSHRGRLGGFRLARDPATLRLLEVVHYIDGTDAMRECLLGAKVCSDDGGCPLHTYWSRVRQTRDEMLSGVVVADLGRVTPHRRRARLRAGVERARFSG